MRSAWPLAVVVVLAIPLGLLLHFAASKKSIRQAVEIQSPETFEVDPAERATPTAPPIEPASPSPFVEPFIPEVPHYDDAERARQHAQAAVDRARQSLKDRPQNRPPVNRRPQAPSPRGSAEEPEELFVHPPAKEDAAAIAARAALDKACAWLLKNQAGWKTRKYGAKWQGTRISADRKTAHVAFGDKRNPECDVTLLFDPLRNRWRVREVRGGGFPQGYSW